MSQKKILISILHPFVLRSIVYSGFVNKLLDAGYEVSAIVPKEKIEFYKSLFPKNINFEGVDLLAVNHSFISKLKRIFEFGIHTNIKLFHAREVLSKDHNYLKFLLKKISMNTIGYSKLLQNLIRKIFFIFTYNESLGFEKYFQKKFDLVLSTDVYNEFDIMLLFCAKKNGVPTVGMIRSWDNNISKILLPIIPDTLITQNEIMTSEVEEIQGVTQAKILSVGIPHYEFYKKYQPIPRNDFLDKVGIPRDSIFIVFSPAGGKFIDHDWNFCQILKEAIEENRLPDNLYVLVRCHPNNTCNLSKFVPNRHFVIEYPGISSGTETRNSELDRKSTEHLIDTLTHGSLVINILSSIIIDAAVIGTPVVVPTFEGRSSSVPFLRSIKRYLIEDCMMRLLNIWNGSLPSDENALISEINRIIKGNTQNDKKALERITVNYCKNFDDSPADSLFNIISSQS